MSKDKELMDILSGLVRDSDGLNNYVVANITFEMMEMFCKLPIVTFDSSAT